MLRYLLLPLLLVLCPSLDVIQAQDQSGFISIDCGLQGANYTDKSTELYYISDNGFVDSGVSQSVATKFEIEQFKTLRYFPEGSRNCYTLRPVQGKGSKYLIRARFMYGNYDNLNQPPKFDLHIGNQYWDTVTIDDASSLYNRREIIHRPSSDHIHVCLVNTDLGIPFISSLELRLLDLDMYNTTGNNGSLKYIHRFNMKATESINIRYKDDIYDRIWKGYSIPNSRTLSSISPVVGQKVLTLPSAVMSTAAVALNTSGHLNFSWTAKDVTSKFYMFLHFAELEVLTTDQIRSLDINLNGDSWQYNFTPPYLTAHTIYSSNAESGNTTYAVDISSNPRATLPPIINAAEVYSLIEFPLQETFAGDVNAMVSIKSTYNITENWQGDPCGPEGFQWNGVNCNNNDGLNHPNIISLNLSSKGLFGSIAPALSELKTLKSLDLSNNSLTGVLPDFLAELDSLTELNLRGNNFSGPCPQLLLEKANTGKLNLLADNLCGDGAGDIGSSGGAGDIGSSGGSVEKTKKNSVVIPIAGAAGGVFLLVICASFLAFYIIKRRKTRGSLAKVNTKADKRSEFVEPDIVTPNSQKSNATAEKMMSSPSQNENHNFIVTNKGRQFTYDELLQITNNFQKVIGKGGSGTVYHGYVGAAQVAVKMLSPSSSQGYKEFQAEANLLLTIHHKNLISLVGYCYEGTNMAIISDYMPNGDMKRHLLGKEPHVLTWEERLRMSLDAAQGLEYLHHGCKPPIVHRDVKITNILVDEKFRAKLADFGLSRAFSVEDATHVSTGVAGTPGYLDPEYFSTGRLVEKSDIYSFGVVLLEVVTGRPALPRNDEMPHIITWVSSELETCNLDRLVDPKLRGDYTINSVWKVLEVAMSCVARISARRPTMNFVVNELNSSLTMETSRNETESKDSIGIISTNMDSGYNPQAR